MYNPNTTIDSLDFEMTDPVASQEESQHQEYEAELPPAVRFVLDVGAHLEQLRTFRLEQEEVA